jgi:hypothetical protein
MLFSFIFELLIRQRIRVIETPGNKGYECKVSNNKRKLTFELSPIDVFFKVIGLSNSLDLKFNIRRVLFFRSY